MKISLIVTGRTTRPYLRQGIAEYASRIPHYAPFELVELPDVKVPRGGRPTPERQKELEGEQLLRQLAPGDRLVLLDERGLQPTSRQLAQWLGRQGAGGSARRLVFAVGGPYGFSPAVYARAGSARDALLALSALTLPHELVRLLFVEQLYRALTILRGEPYHHD